MARRLQPLVAGDLELQEVAGQPYGPDLLSQVEVCRRLGISDQTWMRWRKAGRTPAAVTLPSGRLKWRLVDIDAITRSVTPAAPPRRRHFGKARAMQLVTGRV